MLVRTAIDADMPAVWDTYAAVVERMQVEPPDIWWRMGMHPSRGRLEAAARAGELIIAVDTVSRDGLAAEPAPAPAAPGTVAGALILDNRQGKDYALAPWRAACEASEVRVVHLLCVHPRARGRGVARALLAEAAARSRAAGARSLRLDTFDINRRAVAIYRQFGFADLGVFDIEVGGGLRHASHLMELDLATAPRSASGLAADRTSVLMREGDRS